MTLFNELFHLKKVFLAAGAIALGESFSVYRRRNSLFKLKGLGKYQWIRISAGYGYGLDGELRKLQKLNCFGNPIACKVLLRGYSQVLFKKSVQIAAVDTNVVGDIRNLYGVTVVAAHVSLGPCDIVIVGAGVAFLSYGHSGGDK